MQSELHPKGGDARRRCRNSIFSNGEQGIDLNDNGPTLNDPGDSDSGPNGLQNKPAVISAETGGGQTTIKYKLNSNPDDEFLVQFFSNPKGNEGKKLIGSEVVLSSGGTLTFKPAEAVPAGQNITATATDAVGNTSEFSAAKKVVAS